MANTYKTPDVYVKEISLFPPSVAEVATAIPAFIGYTEKALLGGTNFVTNIPTEVRSLLDYAETFGGPPAVTVSRVDLALDNGVERADISTPYFMYDALQLFFANGGGKCYIVSVGAFDKNLNPPTYNALLGGLNALAKEDEPTLILFPDAVKLANDDEFYALQQQALMQCGRLMDRFCIFDLKETNTIPTDRPGWEIGVKNFRNKIGINDLKYGAAYTPWLKAVLPKNIRYKDIQGKLYRSGALITMKGLTSEKDVIASIDLLEGALADAKAVNGDETVNGIVRSYLEGLSTPPPASLSERFTILSLAFKAAAAAQLASATPDEDAVRPSLQALPNFIYQLVDKIVDDLIRPVAAPAVQPLFTPGAEPPKTPPESLLNHVKGLVTTNLRRVILRLNNLTVGWNAHIGGETTVNAPYGAFTWNSPEWIPAFTTGIAYDNTIFPNLGATLDARQQIQNMSAAEAAISAIFLEIDGTIRNIQRAANGFVDQFENSLKEKFPVLRNILAKVSSTATTLPPSGAVAGIYARVDEARGVWKAPANVSLSSVSGVGYHIDYYEQEDLNVDTQAGKSINAIRPFTGKGVLVWGARTLAGNDNEWRYVPVRRFFNMVEESVKKSTYWAVFEPNDANTWIKVKSMIENYLVQKWRDGALAGAKPEQAFFVKIGLGVTMTSQDILEGRMNVEIGMAVVRPAEFIVLKFMHKLQES